MTLQFVRSNSVRRSLHITGWSDFPCFTNRHADFVYSYMMLVFGGMDIPVFDWIE